MSSTLSAATQDRKARLAQLKSLKRKQPEPSEGDDDTTSPRSPKSPRQSTSPAPLQPSYLSGRNYDAQTKGPKLGFESAPSAATSTPTLEARAASLAEETAAHAAKEIEEDRPLDIFNLQPKKPNWDLKRDLERKLEVLNVRTENAIARLVRERVEGAKTRKGANAMSSGKATGTVEGTENEGDGEDVGMEGNVLVEATKEREREDEEDAKRERELDEELTDGS